MAKPQGLKADTKLLGAWRKRSDTGEENTLRVLPFSEKEQLIVWIDSCNPRDNAFYRAYPVCIKGVHCLQLQILPDSSYTLLQYEIHDSELRYSILNETLVPDTTSSVKSMKRQFKRHIHNSELFLPLDTLRRVDEKYKDRLAE